MPPIIEHKDQKPCQRRSLLLSITLADDAMHSEGQLGVSHLDVSTPENVEMISGVECCGCVLPRISLSPETATWQALQPIQYCQTYCSLVLEIIPSQQTLLQVHEQRRVASHHLNIHGGIPGLVLPKLCPQFQWMGIKLMLALLLSKQA